MAAPTRAGWPSIDAALARHERRRALYSAALVALAAALALTVVWCARSPRSG